MTKEEKPFEDLEEEAENYADNQIPTDYPEYFCRQDIKDGFIDGAKWIMEQGETIEDEVYACQDAEMTPLIEVCPKTFKVGDKVIIQIRKKKQ